MTVRPVVIDPNSDPWKYRDQLNPYRRQMIVNALVRGADDRDQYPRVPLSVRVQGIWPMSSNVQRAKTPADIGVRQAEPRIP